MFLSSLFWFCWLFWLYVLKKGCNFWFYFVWMYFWYVGRVIGKIFILRYNYGLRERFILCLNVFKFLKNLCFFLLWCLLLCVWFFLCMSVILRLRLCCMKVKCWCVRVWSIWLFVCCLRLIFVLRCLFIECVFCFLDLCDIIVGLNILKLFCYVFGNL